MHGILWAVSFIFFKGMCPLLLEEPISVLGAALMGVAINLSYFILTLLTAAPAIKAIDDLAAGRREDETPWFMFGALAAALATAVLLSYFILIGFSARLADEVDLVRDFGDFRTYNMTWFWFSVMVAIPLIVAAAPLFRSVFRDARAAKASWEAQKK